MLYFQSSAVKDAVYESRWYSSPQAFRRSVNIIMLKAQKPVVINALFFSTITLDVFSVVIIFHNTQGVLLKTSTRGNMLIKVNLPSIIICTHFNTIFLSSSFSSYFELLTPIMLSSGNLTTPKTNKCIGQRIFGTSKHFETERIFQY